MKYEQSCEQRCADLKYSGIKAGRIKSNLIEIFIWNQLLGYDDTSDR